MRILTHLERLEAESIHIMREVVAESEKPVMLYSVGKDSAVHAAPRPQGVLPRRRRRSRCCTSTRRGSSGRCSSFATQMAAEVGMELLVHQNPEGVAHGINPFDHGSAMHTDMRKTQGLKQALDQYGFDAALRRRAPRRGEVAGQGAHLLVPRRRSTGGTRRSQRPELWRLYNARKQRRREHPRVPDLELDRARRLAVHPPRGDPDRAAVLRGRAAGGRARRHADHGRRRPHAAASRARCR